MQFNKKGVFMIEKVKKTQKVSKYMAWLGFRRAMLFSDLKQANYFLEIMQEPKGVFE